MEWELTEEDYNNHQIAREGDDEGWGIFSGYVAVVKGDMAAIVNVSHCSCYGTWDGNSLDGGNIEWTGTKEQLLELASQQADPDMPGYTVTVADYDGRNLLALYAAVLKWDRQSRA